MYYIVFKIKGEGQRKHQFKIIFYFERNGKFLYPILRKELFKCQYDKSNKPTTYNTSDPLKKFTIML